MINSDTRIDEALLLRYFEGEVTLSEKDEIEKWIISSEAKKKLAKQIYYLSMYYSPYIQPVCAGIFLFSVARFRETTL